MADISVTVASVQPGTGAQHTIGIAGATITAGQSVYLDSATNTVKLADADASDAVAAAVGISQHAALSGQPIAYQTGGNMTFNAVLTAGKIYCVSATAGGIAPSADVTTNWRTSILGVATSTTNLAMNLNISGVTN
jgi:hypothetical protein